MKIYESRNKVPDKYKWDLKEYFSNNNEFNQTFDKCVKLIDKIDEYKGKIANPNKLLEYLKLDEEIMIMAENLYVYAYLINDQELGVSLSIENKSKTENLMATYESKSSFFAPELLKLTKEEYNKLFENKNLLIYKNLLDRIYRSKKHILGEENEKIITLLDSAMDHFDDLSSTMLNSAHDYGKVKIDNYITHITSTNYSKLIKNKNPNLRKKIYNQYFKVLNQYGDISAGLLNSFVKSESVNAHLHKYKNSWDNKLFINNMPNEAYESLVKNTESNIASYQRYLKLYKKFQGLDTLHIYDLNLDFTKKAHEYSVEEAEELVFNSIKVLGKEYQEKFKKIFANHYIDYMPYKGKCSGGYSFSTSTNNSRILMSFNGDLNSVSTIAHEGGHNVHHQFVKDNNPVIYRNVTSLVSEVASLTNECLLSSYIINNAKNKEDKLMGLSNIIGVINSNLFGAVREGKMEQDFYELVDNGGTITKEYMDKLTIDSLKKYFGKIVKLDKYSCVSWTRRSHYYMFYYLYAYSFCISIAAYIAGEILNGNKEVLDKYIEFLKTGSDKWPIEAFTVLGIDLTKDDVYLGAIKYYNSLLDEFEKIVKEN